MRISDWSSDVCSSDLCRQDRVAAWEILGRFAAQTHDCIDIRNNAHSSIPRRVPHGPPFSNVETTFRLRRRAQFSKFETNQLLVDKACTILSSVAQVIDALGENCGGSC